MSSWSLVPIGEVIELAYGKSLPTKRRSAGVVAVYGANGVAGYHNEALVPEPTIIVGRKGSAGSVHLTEGPSYPIDTTFFVRPRQRGAFDLRYMKLALERANLKRLAITTGVPGLNREDAYRERIPLPPLDEQRRIVELLERAAGIRRLREQALAKTRALIPALFLDMFGDARRIVERFSRQRLDTVADIGSGVTKGRKLNGAASEDLPYLRVANVQDGFLDLSEIKTIPATSRDRERYALKAGDLLMTEGGDPDKLGRAAIWRDEIPDCLHQNHIFRVRPRERHVLPDYLANLAGSSYGKAYFLSVAKRTTGIASINKTQLSAFPVPMPPLNLQRAFAERVADIRAIIAQQERSLDAAHALERSLMARLLG